MTAAAREVEELAEELGIAKCLSLAEYEAASYVESDREVRLRRRRYLDRARRRRVRRSRARCLDCGELGATRGHQTCQYPGEAP